MRNNQSHRRGRLSCATLSIALAISFCVASPAALAQAITRAAVQHQYTIPAGPLANALSAFGAQSRMQVVYAPELVANKKSKGFSGIFTLEGALSHLLKGQGVAWERLNESTFVLRAVVLPPKLSTVVQPSRAEIGRGGS